MGIEIEQSGIVEIEVEIEKFQVRAARVCGGGWWRRRGFVDIWTFKDDSRVLRIS